jgi:hypothetical protein
MTADRVVLREQYLAAIEYEIATAEGRLTDARARVTDSASRRAEALVAISDVTLDWLKKERDRLRAGGAFDEAAARWFLGEDESAG